jgi:Dual specificity phosphatase, catalytic domain
MTNSGANASLLSKSSSKNPPWSPPEKPKIVGLRIEFHETELQCRVKQAGGKWNSAKRVWEIHYIPDRNAPLSRQDTRSLIGNLVELASEGKSIVIHCRQGVGRSAILAACLLTECGISVADAFERIMQARGCPVPDTQDQRAWVAEFASGKLRTV